MTSLTEVPGKLAPPGSEDKAMKMKIFIGSSTYGADEQFNDWFEDLRDTVRVLDYRYQCDKGVQSICVLYTVDDGIPEIFS